MCLRRAPAPWPWTESRCQVRLPLQYPLLAVCAPSALSGDCGGEQLGEAGRHYALTGLKLLISLLLKGSWPFPLTEAPPPPSSAGAAAAANKIAERVAAGARRRLGGGGLAGAREDAADGGAAPPGAAGAASVSGWTVPSGGDIGEVYQRQVRVGGRLALDRKKMRVYSSPH